MRAAFFAPSKNRSGGIQLLTSKMPCRRRVFSYGRMHIRFYRLRHRTTRRWPVNCAHAPGCITTTRTVRFWRVLPTKQHPDPGPAYYEPTLVFTARREGRKDQEKAASAGKGRRCPCTGDPPPTAYNHRDGNDDYTQTGESGRLFPGDEAEAGAWFDNIRRLQCKAWRDEMQSGQGRSALFAQSAETRPKLGAGVWPGGFEKSRPGPGGVIDSKHPRARTETQNKSAAT